MRSFIKILFHILVLTSCESLSRVWAAQIKTLMDFSCCVAGQFSDVGATSCTGCYPGFECPDKTKDGMKQCAPGSYSNGNKKTCMECAATYECPYIE